MRLVLLGKFPPIEGGVSCQTYWAALDMAKRGHEVHVISNASEVESGFREFLFGQDSNRLCGGELSHPIHIHTTSSLRPHAFIPWSNPFSTKLFGTALSVIDEYGCDLILGWYFEPYGVVAAQLGSACNKPVVLRHAGSDLGRLAGHPDLGRTYRWMLSQTTSVLSTGRDQTVVEMLVGLGVQDTNLRVLPVSRLPQIYLEECEPLDVDDLLARLGEVHREFASPADLRETLQRLDDKPFDYRVPTIGVYGKVGDPKGSYRLLEALDTLARRGVQFNFLSLAGARSEELLRYCSRITDRKDLASRTWVLPLLAPWRIPSFLKRCNLVCFLEHNFAIKFHTPLVPREVLASGACLVLSEEVANKQAFRDSLVTGKNVVVIPDPNDSDYLADQIEGTLVDEQRAYVIGRHGQFLSETCEKFFWERNATADALENVWNAL